MSCLFLLENHNGCFKYIAKNHVRLGVVIDLIAGALFSVILGIISTIMLLLSLCITSFFYIKTSQYSATLVSKDELKNTCLDVKFLLIKVIEILALLVPIFGFLSLFFYKVYSVGEACSWSKCFFANISILKIPEQLLHSKVDLHFWCIHV